MSSVASKQALLLALGGVSIAALFVWYIQKQKRDEERKKRKLEELNNVAKPAAESSTAPTVGSSAAAAATSTKKSRRNKRNSDSLSESNGHVANGNVIHETQKQEDVVIEASNEEKTQTEKPLEVVAETGAAEIEVERKADENKEAEIEGVLPEAEQKIEEIEVAVEEKTVELLNGTEQEETVGKKEQEEVEVEEMVQKVEVKKTQAAAKPAPIQMPNNRRTVESEQIPEEPTPTKLLDKPLTLEIIAQMSPASWSEETEKYSELVLMELFIELHDHVGFVHKKFQSKFDNQSTLDQLKEKIHSKFFIENEEQQLFFEDGRELNGLGENSLQSFGLKHGSKMIIKHALLDTWSSYLFLYQSAKETKNSKPERIKCGHVAISNSKKLEDSGFFDAYSNFVQEWVDTIGKMMRLVDRTKNALKQSATTFFSEKYPNSKIEFKPKQGGTRAGLVIGVTCKEEVTHFYMKTYHHAGPSISNTSTRHLPDLREMFAYRLLEVIGVGPVVFFPFYAGSIFIHYIATKEVEEFKELDKLEDGCAQKAVVVEAYLISLILGIRDLNEGNFGLTKDETLSIVDFYVPDSDNFLRRNIYDEFMDKSKFGGVGKANEILTEIRREERMRIAKVALPRWSEINSMTTDIIGIEKRELREHGIKFGTCTNDVDDYLQDIKSNYASICLAMQISPPNSNF